MAPRASSSLRRSPVETPAFDLAIIFAIIFSAVFAFVLAVIGSMLYLRLKRKREEYLKQQMEPEKAKFEKPELSGDPSFTIHEMDPRSEIHELPERRDGQPHELSENSVPQELPENRDGRLHELPGEEKLHQGIPTAIRAGTTFQSETTQHDKEKSLASGVSKETNGLNMV
ncbi:hypothetical protein GGR51DRAFT_488139 [Nemania sp. FL0031]|nr:hypothetical protein GGR51DRAFT_488139 [Nemania sp. FL0031]